MIEDCQGDPTMHRKRKYELKVRSTTGKNGS